MIVQENYRARLKMEWKRMYLSQRPEQMNNLVKKKYISKGDVVELLEKQSCTDHPKKGDAKFHPLKMSQKLIQ